MYKIFFLCFPVLFWCNINKCTQQRNITIPTGTLLIFNLCYKYRKSCYFNFFVMVIGLVSQGILIRFGGFGPGYLSHFYSLDFRSFNLKYFKCCNLFYVCTLSARRCPLYVTVTVYST